MRTFYSVVLALWAVSAQASAIIVDLGTAEAFAVLGGSTVTNTGATTVFGGLGVAPGTAITGFPPGVVSGGAEHSADAVALLAQSDLTTAYNFAAGQACDSNLSDQDLGGLTLTPGVYCFSEAAQLTGALTLDGEGDPNAVFLFQIGSSLTTSSGSSILFINSGRGDRLFWQAGASATLGTSTAFAGNILALSSITLDTSASIQCGRALARNGAVTMDTNDVSTEGAACPEGTSGTSGTTGTTGTTGSDGPGGGSAVPEASTVSLLLLSGSFTLLWRRLRTA